MVPRWLKQSKLYEQSKQTARVMERKLLQGEYKLLTDSSRKPELLDQISTLPHSNGSRYYTRLPFRVGMVGDPFLFYNYASTCDLIYLTPENWLTQLPQLDCVIVTSVWHGLHEEWTGVSQPGSAASDQLCQLMKETKRHGCPIIFYSKEDPPNFNCFRIYAALSDQIYTSASECIERYQDYTGGIPVDIMHFAISPHLHNPIGMKRLDEDRCRAFFAGSWMKKYPKRVQQEKELFDWVRRSGLQLDIADRNYSRYCMTYRYPLKYLRCVLPNFSYEEISQLYKLYDWILNLNSVSESADMFSLRVYDALACGSLVLSNKSVGMERYFPQVYVIEGYEQLLDVLHTPVPELEQRRLAGIRQVFRVGTVYEKMAYMLRSVGLNGQCAANDLVGVIPVKGGTEAENGRALFEAQTYKNKVWLGCQPDDAMVRTCGMFAYWDHEQNYPAHYLEDMVNGFKYTNSDYITTELGTSPQEAGQIYTTSIKDRCCTLFWADSFGKVQEGTVPNGYQMRIWNQIDNSI